MRLKIGEAAMYLGVTPSTLRRWDKLGKLKSERNVITGHRYYYKKELDKFLDIYESARIKKGWRF